MIDIEAGGIRWIAKDSKELVNLVKKFDKLRGQIGIVEKDSRNEHFRYGYVSYEAFAAKFRHLLPQVGLAFALGHEHCKREEKNRILQLNASFIDTDTGAMLILTFFGEGWDNTDKGVAKALTNGIKYGLMRTMLVSSKDDVKEPDASDGEVVTDYPKTKGTSTFNQRDAVYALQKDLKIDPAVMDGAILHDYGAHNLQELSIENCNDLIKRLEVKLSEGKNNGE